MPSKVTLDRNWYSRTRDVYAQLTENFGSSLDTKPLWSIHQLFGYTHVDFLNDSDAKLFQAWVNANAK
jgi:hypothetical protein